MNASTTIATGTARTQSQARIITGMLALFFGAALFVGTGFAAPSLIHNATHDTRHALGLPCH